MAQWVTVAEGTSLVDLRATVEDMELPKGTKMKVIMDTSMPWLFDAAGAEFAFQPFVPEGMELIDVYGGNGQGIVDMEADPAWLLAVLAFMKAHWLAITIAGIALYFIISFIRVMVQMPAAAQIPVTLLVGVAIGIIGLIALSAHQRKPI